MTLSLGQISGAATFVLFAVIVWAAVYSKDPDRREAAQRVLAIFRRNSNIPTVQPPQASHGGIPRENNHIRNEVRLMAAHSSHADHVGGVPSVTPDEIKD